MKISYTNGNITTFEEPGLDGDIEQTADNQKTVYHLIIWDARLMCWK